ncbi:MAG: hypothetical protein FWF20_11515 [Betaproteobacteria bacterium]|nr:hypothetical protein [Betaproteobacteria bacterium]
MVGIQAAGDFGVDGTLSRGNVILVGCQRGALGLAIGNDGSDIPTVVGSIHGGDGGFLGGGIELIQAVNELGQFFDGEGSGSNTGLGVNRLKLHALGQDQILIGGD